MTCKLRSGVGVSCVEVRGEHSRQSESVDALGGDRTGMVKGA